MPGPIYPPRRMSRATVRRQDEPKTTLWTANVHQYFIADAGDAPFPECEVDSV